MKFSLRKTSLCAAFICEALGLLALFLAPEAERILFLAPLLVIALSVGLGFRLHARPLLLLLTLGVLAGYLTAAGAPTGTLLARAIIPAHALLWLANEEAIYRFWRLGLALLELVLAAILAPEVHMFVLIFIFVITGSLALSLGFLEQNFRQRDPEALGRPLRGSYLGTLLALSCVIFLSSLLIFPLLPRSRWSGEGSNANVGYSDSVSFRHSIRFWAKQDSRPVLWIFRSNEHSWDRIIPSFLLRGQALESFNGEEWRSSTRKITSEKSSNASEFVDVIRQPMQTDVLPVPYSAAFVTAGPDLGATRYTEGEWLASGSRTRRVKYKVALEQNGSSLGPGAEAGSPSLQFDSLAYPRLARLAAELGAGATSDEERIRRVGQFFREGGFKYELGEVAAAEKGGTHPIESFLFDKKSGHCELFASAAALMLRALGQPARLVVGFRLRPPSRGDVLTVHTTDAHAWIEAWSRERGWVPLDFTPVMPETGWASETLGEVYDWIGAYWHRYILDYEFTFSFSFSGLLTVAGGLLLVLAAMFLRWNKWRISKAGTREMLAGASRCFEDELLYRGGLYLDEACSKLPEARAWRTRYIELRFGRQAPTVPEVKEMKRLARQILVKASQAQKSAA